MESGLPGSANEARLPSGRNEAAADFEVKLQEETTSA